MFALGYVFFGLGLIPVQAFNGAGDTFTPTVLNFLCQWVLGIPLSYYLAVHLGYAVRGVILATVVAEITLAILALILFRRGGWKTKQI